MKKIFQKIKKYGLAGLTLGTLLAASCTEKPYALVKIEELIKNSKEYHNKNVITYGLPIEIKAGWESYSTIFGVLIQSERGDTLYVEEEKGYRKKRFPVEAISRELVDGDTDVIRIFGTFDGKKGILYAKYIQVGDTLY